MFYPRGKKSNPLNIQHLLTSKDYEVLQVNKGQCFKSDLFSLEDHPGSSG